MSARFAALAPALCLTLLAAFPPAHAAPDPAPDKALTIYNQNFAVVRQTLPLTLEAGLNHVAVSDITYHLEPDSVVLVSGP